MLLIHLRYEKRKQQVVTQYSDENIDIKKKDIFYPQCSVYHQPFISNSMEGCCEDNSQAAASYLYGRGFCTTFKETPVEIMAPSNRQQGKQDFANEGVLMNCNCIPGK